MKKLTILAALMLAAPSANAAWYPWIDGENYVERCLPVIRDFVKNDDLKRASNSEQMFCMAFAAAVAEVTDRACTHSVALNPFCQGLLIGGKADSDAAAR
jgi:hypothetical protein